MPTATLTTREVKNKTTGLDISIPSYKEIPGLLGSNVEFNVVVVSSLTYFKSPKHKETDVVQFMIPRKFTDFEQLYIQISGKFPGTILPPLPKKVLRLTEAVIKDRKARLEDLLKFLASTPKLSKCSKLLEFLGVNAIKAGRYLKGEVTDTVSKDDCEKNPVEVLEDDGGTLEEDLFSEDLTKSDEEETDIFTSDRGGDGEDMLASRGVADPKLFDDQDLGGGIEESEEEEFLGFTPVAMVTNRTHPLATDGEYSDILQIDDDLDQLLTLDKQKADKVPDNPEIKGTALLSENIKPPALNVKPSLPQKPPLSQKPGHPQKPSLAKKPNIGKKPQITSKKPVLHEKPSHENSNTNYKETTGVTDIPKGDYSSNIDNKAAIESSNLADDDILKYIQDNASADDDEVDLFS